MKKTIFLFFAAILCAMTANAYNQSAVDLYFDNSEAKWNSCYVYIGHSTWTSVYPLTRVSGTQYLWKLAKADFNGGGAWNGATGWVLCYEKWWDSKDESIDKYTWHGAKNVTKKRTSAWSASYIYKTNGTVSVTSNGNTINAYNTTTVSNNNYTVTINTVEGGTLTVKDYDNAAVATGASKIYLTVLKFSATPASGYVLDAVEINDGTNTTTIAAADLASTTHTLKSNVTINPVWRATTSTVTVTTSATNGSVTGGGVVEEGTSVTLTATPDAGYKFANWTVGGAEVSTANPYTFTAEEDVTVVANFEELPKATIYFVNNAGWSKIQAYAWGDNGTNASWAGVDITANKLADKIGEYDVYSYTVIQGSYKNVIFNDGSAQTKDYVWTDGNYYWHNEAVNFAGGTKAQAEEKFSVPVEYDYVYLINTNDWAKAHIYTWESEVAGWPGAAMTKEAEQIAGKDVYSYKVVKGTTFGGMLFNCGGDECKTGNLTWQAGKYYAPSKDTWYADAAAAEAGLAAPVVYTYTIVGSSAPLFGVAWATEKAENDMTLVEGTKYELVKTDVSLTVGEIQYKVAVNHAWTESYPADNAILNIAEAGKYTITFTFDSNTKAVNATAELTEAAVVLPTVGVKGAWDGWAATTTLTGDNTSAAAIVNITTADVYEFGLDVDGNFQASGATIDKANNSTVVTTNAGNMKLTANILGEYTFTWTYETNTLTVTYPAGEEVEIAKKYYIAGTEELTGFNWQVDGLQLTKDGDLYKHTFSALAAGTFEFKVTNGTWTDPWGFGNLSAAYEEVSEGTDGEGNPNGNIKFTTEEAKNITVIFDATAGKITIDGLTEKVPVEKHYYLIGTFNEWTLADANYELALVDGLYKKEVTLAKDAEFKVNQGDWDASWGKDNLGGKTYAELDYTDDGNIKMKEEKTFTVIFNLTENLITFEGLTVVEDFYTIVGATAITGVNWDPANEDNKMTKDGEAYTLTKIGLKLVAGDYEYKVAKNGAWGDGQYPAEGQGNKTLNIADNGEYTIVYTYTVGTSLEAVATKTGEYTPAQAVYTVAGDAALCGTNWQADDTANDMTANGDGTYTWTKTDVTITGTVGFKVVKNHDFGNGAYPNDNWNIVPENYEGNAIYTVTITFTESSKEIAVALTKTGEATPPVIIYVLMGVNGDWDNGIALTQNPGNEDEYVLENQVIIKATDAVKVVTLTDGTATAWCGNVDTWSNATYTGGGDDNIVLEDGIYTFYFKKTANNIYINQTGYARNVTNQYGTICLPYASASTTGAIFYRVAGKEEGKVYLESVDAPEAGVPYIFEATAGTITVTYQGEAVAEAGTANGLVGTFTEITVPNGDYILYNNAFCTNEPAGTLNKIKENRAYLDMDAVTGGAPQQLPGRRYIGMKVQGEGTTTGFENITTTDKAVKVIENGQLIIIRDGVKYNAQGIKFQL